MEKLDRTPETGNCGTIEERMTQGRIIDFIEKHCGTK